MKRLPLLNLVARAEDMAELDRLVAGTKSVVNSVMRPRWLRGLLHGVPIGHPVHPLAVQVPLGACTSAAVLDFVPATERASCVLVGVGVVSALPSAVAGFTDWSELHKQQQRVGVIHAAANVAATSLYVVSFNQRIRGRQARCSGM